MTGRLAATFFGRAPKKRAVFFELWAYPDGTFNLVLADPQGDGRDEIFMPCSLPQLVGLTRGGRLSFHHEDGVLSVFVSDNRVCAERYSPAFDRRFRICIDGDEFRHAIELLQNDADHLTQ